MKKFTTLMGLVLALLCTNAQTIVNVHFPVPITTANAQSSLNPNDYTWQNPNNTLQGVTLYMPPATSPYKPTVFLQQNNARLAFSLSNSGQAFHQIEVSYDNGGYSTVFLSGGNVLPRENYGWVTPPSSFTTLGSHQIKVRYLNVLGTSYVREFDVVVVEDAQEFHNDNVTAGTQYNYRNKLTVWKGPNASNQKVLLLVSGFDATNTIPAEFYRAAGDVLFQKLIDNNYKIYVLTFAFNAQDMRKNAAVVHSAIDYVSSLNNNNDIIVAGMSMGGVISRYALAKDEADQKALGATNYLPVSHFISMDAPQQGAVISPDLISFIDANNSSNYTVSTMAFKQLVRNNPISSSSQEHAGLYSQLHNINGTGYPSHCLNIGVAFSKPTLTNNFTGNTWLTIDANLHTAGVNWGSVKNHTDVVNGEETYAGSLLPKTTGAFSDMRTLWNLLNVATNRSVTNHPTFIPHFSALDVVNGTSKFCVTLFPENNASLFYHDQIPIEIVDPLLQLLEADNLNIIAQNTTYNFAKGTTKYVLNNLDVYGEMLVNNNALAGSSTSPLGPAPDINSHFTLGTNACQGVNIAVQSGGELKVGDATGHASGDFSLDKNSTITVKAGAKLVVANHSKLIIHPGANFIFEDGATIELLGNNAVLEIQGKVTVPDNTDLTFTGSGKLVIDQFIWGGNEDDFWDIGQNASLSFIGSTIHSDVVLECKSNFIPRMQNGHTFSQITVKNGKIEMHENTTMFVASPLEMRLVKMDVVGANGLSAIKHGGLYLYGQNNISLTGCHFYNAENGIYNNLTGATQMFTLNSGVFRYCINGLYTDGRNAKVTAIFENNSIGWKHENMLGQSFLTNATFSNNGTGAFFNGGNAIANAKDNTFNNNGVGLRVNNISAKVQCNDIEHNYFGIEAYNALVYLNENAYNKFFDNVYGLYGQFGDGDAINLYNGKNSFSLGTTGVDYINAQFNPNALISPYQHNGNWVIDADNNKMPLEYDPPFGNNPGGYFMPISMTFYPTPNSNLTNLYLDVPNNLSSITRTCGSGGISNDVNFEDYILNQFTSAQVLGSTNYSGMSLKAALIDAAGFVSTEETQENDLVAIDRLHEILTENYDNITQDDYNLLQVGYKLLTKALTRAYKFGDLTTVNADPTALVNGHLDKVILSIDAMKARVDSTWPTASQANFRYHLDEALMYRTGGYYEEAISKLMSASNWSPLTEINLANYWLCTCKAERDFLQQIISQEQFNVELQLCKANTNSFKTQAQTFANTAKNYIGRAKAQQMRLLPNPAKEETTVYFENAIGGTLRVVNVHGIELERKIVEKGQRKLVLKVDGFISGVYFVVYETEGEKFSSKLVKE